MKGHFYKEDVRARRKNVLVEPNGLLPRYRNRSGYWEKKTKA